MKIVFVSNYYNHHQSALSESLAKCDDVEYTFIETEQMEQERKALGWGMEQYPDFIKRSYISEQSMRECLELINAADVVIHGSAPEMFLKKRLKEGKLTFKYSERIYKEGFKHWQQPLRVIKNYARGWSKKNHYLLCASAYTYADFSKTFNFHNRAYKWGYFPAVKKYENFESIMTNKQPASILWVARLIELKHPDASIRVAERLRNDGYRFKLNLIGSGVMAQEIGQSIRDKGLTDCVEMLGAMKPEQVREHMEKAEIFLFTSDFNEGWGAVLNESMNSGCAVVASHAIGSVPFLIRDGVNGLIYKNGDIDDLYDKVKYLLDNPEKRMEIGRQAYKTLKEEWNAENAAHRFLEIVKAIQSGNLHPDLYTDGPCSKAEKLKNNWYKKNE